MDFVRTVHSSENLDNEEFSNVVNKLQSQLTITKNNIPHSQKQTTTKNRILLPKNVNHN